jgi:hypothetical protein
MDGDAGPMSSSCYCSSCPKDCIYIAGISARVITSAMAVIPSRDALKFIASNYLIMVKRIFPD